jgi:L-2-hydroxyglutarate oxidase LhgO
MKFGPDIEWINVIDFSVDACRLHLFDEPVQRFWPAVEREKWYPDYAGIRPKLSGRGGVPIDFVLSGPEHSGLPGYVALFGIESPGLTSCLSLADTISDLFV